ncbi:glycosyltransferase [Pedobacter nyackensis]|uniref:Glycosyl transferase family 1 domain-containing protein n=1 Tax=Pedobacter nyackensis TaxID=475255 RepID=A0A1W2BIY5_9SPHI|nr:glycosyltransferase [Pedobacter nyackensis]SMC72831.1 hypothetical protein SAMN04488101_102514 [Pedobacter nyackensis]
MNLKRSIAKRVNRIFAIEKGKVAERPIINLYNTNYDKRVLISYIQAPFRETNSFKHQNYLTSHIVAESFSERCYNVDVIDYRGDFDIEYESYSAIFGFGANFERSFYSKRKDIPRIHFITGAHPDLQNAMSLQSVNDFYDISGLWLPTEANIIADNCYYSTFGPDASVILAQGFVFEDHKKRVKGRLHSLNNNILGVFKEFRPKEGSNNNFLYLSGSRLITKGLHILLEVAKQRKDLNFYIVVFDIDQDLSRYYHDLLWNSSNVFLYQNLRMDSEEMRLVVENCSYCIAPSYIDGLPGGTIEPMVAGLVPIVSKYCGFPSEEFIFELGDLSVSGLNETIDRALSMDNQSYLEASNAVKDYALENYSVSNVKQALLEILDAELL